MQLVNKKIRLSVSIFLVIISIISCFSISASAATVNNKYSAVSYNWYTGSTKPVTNDYFISTSNKKKTEIKLCGVFTYAGLSKADAACCQKKASSLLKFDVYVTEVATKKTVQSHYYKSSGYKVTLPANGKNYYVTVVSYFSNYKKATGVNSTMATNTKFYITKKLVK